MDDEPRREAADRPPRDDRDEDARLVDERPDEDRLADERDEVARPPDERPDDERLRDAVDLLERPEEADFARELDARPLADFPLDADARRVDALAPELERFVVDFDFRVARRWSRAASSWVAPASTRLPTALTALRAVLPIDFAASDTFWPVSLAALFTCVSLRLALCRLRVAAAFLADACR